MILVDTAALYALLDVRDPSHPAAAKRWEVIARQRESLHTTNYIVVEATMLLQARLGLNQVRNLHHRLLPVIRTHALTTEEHDAAIDLLLAEDKRPLSLVDCSSFIFMRRHHINRVFTFDDDFRRFGFEVI